MRIYYIFSIRKEVLSVVKDKPYNLYKMLESIYMMNNDDVVLGFKTFEKLCNIINKNNISKVISDKNIDNINYSCFKNTHVINDFLKDESTKLIINNSHIKLKSNVIFPVFLSDLTNVENLFVCDFINMDYFFLSSMLTGCKM